MTEQKLIEIAIQLGGTFLILAVAFAVACLLGLILAPLMDTEDSDDDNDQS